MSAIYALPVKGHGPSDRLKPAHARKRGINGQFKATDNGTKTTSVTQLPIVSSEYQAVLTPEERSQRRIAGLDLLEEPPEFPFPHASPDQKSHRESVLEAESPGRKDKQPRSLHLQHLAAMMAVLHRCILEQDFKRASRALSLILRGNHAGHLIDIRGHGMWGLAAEVLLRRDAPRSSMNRVQQRELVQHGFMNAKKLYELMIVQFPFSKTWHTHTNSIDFYLAMFNIWIHTVQRQASLELAALGEMGELALEDECEIKTTQLKSAREIAARMDACMAMVPYSDVNELVRLRAMVALWIADLLQFLAESGEIREVDADTGPIKPEHFDAADPRMKESLEARDLSLRLLAKIETS